MTARVGFLITGFDQKKSIRFSVKRFREIWKKTRSSPIVVVMTGDKERDVHKDWVGDKLTRTVHLDDIVGPYFKTMVSRSIMKQMRHGMIEMEDVVRANPIDVLVHFHGDVVLLNENGFLKEINKWLNDSKHRPIAADPVSPGGPWHLPNLCGLGKDYHLKWFGHELMPQLFAVKYSFCENKRFMFDMTIEDDLEEKATEWALIGNLYRATGTWRAAGYERNPSIDVYKDKIGPYKKTFDDYVYPVKKSRQQWGTHSHFGGFCHFGNQLKFTNEELYRKNREQLSTAELALWDSLEDE